MEPQKKPDFNPEKYDIHKFGHYFQSSEKLCSMKKQEFGKATMEIYKYEFDLQSRNYQNVVESIHYEIDSKNKFFYNFINLMETDLEEFVKVRAKKRAEKNRKLEKLKKPIPAYETSISIDELKGIIGDIIKGLYILQTKAKIAHRNLKPKAILFDNPGTVYLTDLYCAVEINESNSQEKVLKGVGSPRWVAPEMVIQLLNPDSKGLKNCDLPQGDIFSLGLIILFCLDYEEFEKSKNLNLVDKNMNKYLVSLQEKLKLPPKFYELLKRMLSFEVGKRPTIIELHALIDEEAPMGDSLDTSFNLLDFGHIKRFELDSFVMPEIKSRIGKGAYAFVYKITYNGKEIAVKSISSFKENLTIDRTVILNELSLMLLLEHENIIKAFHYAIVNDTLHILMEFHGVDLDEILSTKKILIEDKKFITTFLEQTVDGLAYAWEIQFAVHRDLKPANILFDEVTYTFKITDFNASKIIKNASIKSKHPMTLARGSPPYMSPEQLKDYNKNEDGHFEADPKRTDIFSLGLILLEIILCSDCLISQANKDKEKLFKLLEKAAKKDLPVFIKFLLPSMLSYNPELRPDILELSFMVKEFLSEKLEVLDSQAFLHLVKRNPIQASIWLKYLAPFIVASAEQSVALPAESYDIHELLKAEEKISDSLIQPLSQQQAHHRPLLLSYFAYMKLRGEEIPYKELDEFLACLNNNKVEKLNSEQIKDILKKNVEKAAKWIIFAAPFLIFREKFDKCDLVKYLEILREPKNEKEK